MSINPLEAFTYADTITPMVRSALKWTLCDLRYDSIYCIHTLGAMSFHMIQCKFQLMSSARRDGSDVESGSIQVMFVSVSRVFKGMDDDITVVSDKRC